MMPFMSPAPPPDTSTPPLKNGDAIRVYAPFVMTLGFAGVPPVQLIGMLTAISQVS